MSAYLTLWAAGASLLLFCLMGVDKGRARAGKWRVPEKTLWLFALLLGAAGGVLGMRIFRHKTKHLAFQIGFPVLALIDIAVLLWLWLR